MTYEKKSRMPWQHLPIPKKPEKATVDAATVDAPPSPHAGYANQQINEDGKPPPEYNPNGTTPGYFQGKHPIDLTGGRHPLLSPHQFQYPARLGQPVMEVDSNKFQKAIIKDRCSGPDTIFTFYENVRHIASSFHILLLPLNEVTPALGTCQLTPYNCLGYDNVREVMSTSLLKTS